MASTSALKVSPCGSTRILRTLGRGAYGSVCLARAPGRNGNNRSVELALKVPRGETLTSESDASWRRDKIISEASFLR